MKHILKFIYWKVELLSFSLSTRFLKLGQRIDLTSVLWLVGQDYRVFIRMCTFGFIEHKN